jgi:hypothetical protein
MADLFELRRRADLFCLQAEGPGAADDPAEGLDETDARIVHCLVTGQTPEEADAYCARIAGFVGRLKLRMEGRPVPQVPGDPHCAVCLGSLTPGVPCDLCALERRLAATGFK